MLKQRTAMFSKTGSLGATDAINLGIGRTIWIADAHRDGKRYALGKSEESVTTWRAVREFVRNSAYRQETQELAKMCQRQVR